MLLLIFILIIDLCCDVLTLVDKIKEEKEC